jgi:hypothetical protein
LGSATIVLTDIEVLVRGLGCDLGSGKALHVVIVKGGLTGEGGRGHGWLKVALGVLSWAMALQFWGRG